jgi:hypothetical protein
MKKLALGLGVGIVLLLVAAYVAATYFLGHIVVAGVNAFGPRLTQTKVALGGATVSPFTGSGTLRDLAVANPRGWSGNDAFRLGHIHVDIVPSSLFGSHILIEEITIDRPEFLYETRLVSSNIKDLLKSIEEFSRKKDAAQQPKAQDGQPIRIAVKKFRLTNGVARLGVGPAAVPVPLPPIALDDLGTAEGGVTPDQLAGAVMRSVLASIASGTADALGQVAGTAGATGVEKTKDAAKKAGEGLKKLFGKDDKP